MKMRWPCARKSGSPSGATRNDRRTDEAPADQSAQLRGRCGEQAVPARDPRGAGRGGYPEPRRQWRVSCLCRADPDRGHPRQRVLRLSAVAAPDLYDRRERRAGGKRHSVAGGPLRSLRTHSGRQPGAEAAAAHVRPRRGQVRDRGRRRGRSQARLSLGSRGRAAARSGARSQGRYASLCAARECAGRKGGDIRNGNARSQTGGA